MSSGFKDKLYWRDPRRVGKFHCFKKYAGKWASLCSGGGYIDRSGGQSINRPAVHLRCGACDGLEMKRRGWTESGPATI